MRQKKRRRCKGHLLRSNPVSKIPIILLIAWMWPGGARAATLRETLANKLTEYCIPRNENICTSLYSKAVYDKNTTSSNKCRCPCEDQKYDTTQRMCVDCEDGSTSQYATSCTIMTCKEGFKAVEITTTCPEGYRLAVIDSCPAGHYALETPRICDFGLYNTDGTQSKGCPKGYILKAT